MDVTLAEVFSFVLSNGLTPVLLVLFVWYFLNRDKTRDEQMKQQMETSRQETDQRIEENNKRTDMIMAECAKREELIRTEADKREKMIKEEAAKRENHLMINMDKIVESMEKTSKAMQEINMNMQLMQEDITRIESKINIGGGRDESNGS
ncbi:MAG: hypothetical protein IJ079_03820 [Lachnospiraceae bacterium]|nr:hypothetical protein [Lachnospiraceae bacterium]MBR1567536.1 hypothetical protein [Lachnospiraceae bacterium]MBR1568692.1 hypothetical protein [Lachnospiraceae bacterium]